MRVAERSHYSAKSRQRGQPTKKTAIAAVTGIKARHRNAAASPELTATLFLIPTRVRDELKGGVG